MKKRNKKGGALPVLIFLAFLFLFPTVLTGAARWQKLNILILTVLVLAGLGFCVGARFRKGREKDGNYSVPFRPVSPGAGKTCPNPETHRHYEAGKPCPNPEPHGHYSGVSQPLTQFEQDAAARKKRLENMKILYNAGILTREEYDYEVRRLKKL